MSEKTKLDKAFDFNDSESDYWSSRAELIDKVHSEFIYPCY